MNRSERRRQQKQAKKTATAPKRTAPIADVQAAIDAAVGEHSAGRLEDAEKRYRAILQNTPANPVVLNLLGIVCTQKGHAQAALAHLTEAVRVKPDFAEAHGSLANALKALGRLDDAIASYQTALTLKPDYVNVLFNLGTTLMECERLDEARAALEQAITLKPDFIQAHNNRANALHRLGRLEEAVAAYKQALKLDPKFAEAHNNLGSVYHDAGLLDDAITCFDTALRLHPGYAVAHKNIANALRLCGRFDAALHHGAQAVRLDPDFAEAYNALGAAHQDLGQLTDAQAQFRKAIQAAPNFGVAHRHLAGVKKHTTHDSDVEAMERAFNDPDIADDQKAHLGFGLGKAFEDLREDAKAFDYFAQGNALKRASVDYAPSHSEQFFTGIKNVFTADFIAEHVDAAIAEARPLIFIIGMPRSGTSLVEQILASHADVFGAGELKTLGQIVATVAAQRGGTDMPSGIQDVSSAALHQMGAAYLAALDQFDTDAPWLTDKMPENFFNLGIIKSVFPNAKIVHCRRNPADTGLSIFKTYFAEEGHPYAYDLAEIGHYYNLYADLMDHWESIMPGFAHTVRYEDMIAAPEDTIRALLTHCGLGWDAACLNFSATKRPVQTASAAQVRQPIYKTSVQAWKKFERQLQPMVEVFRPSLRDEIG